MGPVAESLGVLQVVPDTLRAIALGTMSIPGASGHAPWWAWPSLTGWLTLGVGILSLLNAAWTTYFSFFQRARVRLYPADELGIVVAPGESPRGLHLRCNMVNGAVKLGVVHHVEVVVTAPDGHQTRFRWHLFFKYVEGGGALSKEADAHPVAVRGRDAATRFIEFKAKEDPRWMAGRHRVEIVGWVNRGLRADRSNLRTLRHVDIPEAQAKRINEPDGFSVYTERVRFLEWCE